MDWSNLDLNRDNCENILAKKMVRMTHVADPLNYDFSLPETMDAIELAALMPKTPASQILFHFLSYEKNLSGLISHMAEHKQELLFFHGESIDQAINKAYKCAAWLALADFIKSCGEKLPYVLGLCQDTSDALIDSEDLKSELETNLRTGLKEAFSDAPEGSWLFLDEIRHVAAGEDISFTYEQAKKITEEVFERFLQEEVEQTNRSISRSIVNSKKTDFSNDLNESLTSSLSGAFNDAPRRSNAFLSHIVNVTEGNSMLVGDKKMQEIMDKVFEKFITKDGE